MTAALWFVDVETSGLDPETGSLLEIACLLVDKDLEPVGVAFHALVGQPAEVLDGLARLGRPDSPEGDLPGVDRSAAQMHRTSGLAGELAALGLQGEPRPVAAVEADLLRWLADHRVDRAAVPLAGSTVSFDRAWLRRHMPAVEAHAHYRNVDVSSVKELAARGVVPLTRWVVPDGGKTHRAAADLEASLEELRCYRDQLAVSADDRLVRWAVFKLFHASGTEVEVRGSLFRVDSVFVELDRDEARAVDRIIAARLRPSDDSG